MGRDAGKCVAQRRQMGDQRKTQSSNLTESSLALAIQAGIGAMEPDAVDRGRHACEIKRRRHLATNCGREKNNHRSIRNWL